MRSRARALTIGLALACVLIAADYGSVRAADAARDEYTVKAAMVYNFIRFTTWPAGTDDDGNRSVRVAVIGGEDLRDAFAKLAGREVDGRQIEVRFADNPDDVAGCQLLFLASEAAADLPAILSATDGASLLAVGESNGFLQSGGMINLHIVGKKVRFQVNLDNARARNLKISSRLLKLASKVVNDGVRGANGLP